ncbi:MAG TPA: hypothetical protein VEJ67_10955 [Candidatus Cybelea sp.]|nr:hypothetical protein [Candidatus Cybelea sp.]
MKQQSEERLLLTEAAPAFSVELRRLLEEQGESELAAQVRTKFPASITVFTP